jgi:tetratricopeptide (TPR) repeat protein
MRAIESARALLQARRLPEAAEAGRRIAVAWPSLPDGYFIAGRSLLQLGRPADARVVLARAVERAPSQPMFLMALADAEAASGDRQAAANSYLRAAAAGGENPDLLAAAGYALGNLGRLAEAEACYRRVLALQPHDAEIWSNLGYVLQKQDRIEDAETALRRALELDPSSAIATDGVGNLFKEQDRLEESLPFYRHALALKPDFALCHFHLGNTLNMLGDSDAGLASLDRALELDPTLAEAASIRGQALMGRGDFRRGLAGYEARRGAAGWPHVRPIPPGPEWDGRPLGDAPLLVWAEQGLGDHLLYAHLFLEVLKRAPKAVFETDRRLTGLLKRGLPAAQIIAERDANGLPANTHHVPLGSLMRCLAPWPVGFVPLVRYLEPDAERQARARAWLDSLGPGPFIGLSWRSQAKLIGRGKTLPLEAWAPLLRRRDVVFVNLQYGDTEAEVGAAQQAFGCRIETMPSLDRFDDIEGLAALVDCLDLTVTTSNVTAHLTGALGKAGWLLLQKPVPLWYWAEGLRPDGLLFYPSLKPFRQAAVRDWSGVMEAVATRLDSWMATRPSAIPAA